MGNGFTINAHRFDPYKNLKDSAQEYVKESFANSKVVVDIEKVYQMLIMD